MDMAEYKNTFCEYTTIKKRFGNSWRTKEFITKYHNVDYLYSIIAPYVYECDLELEIGKQYIDLSYSLSTEDAEEYKKLKEKYLDDETLQWKNNNIFLELTQKMQHLYCNTEEKFEVLGTFLKDADKSKVIIYRKFIDSETELKKRFPDIKICSIQSHAYGLNLQEYDTIIGWDKVWDYALVKQRDHRIFRTGQKNDCRFVSMTGNVNLESLMDSNIDKKGKLLSYFKSHGFKKLAEQL